MMTVMTLLRHLFALDGHLWSLLSSTQSPKHLSPFSVKGKRKGFEFFMLSSFMKLVRILVPQSVEVLLLPFMGFKIT
jgi:hypothetical protein